MTTTTTKSTSQPGSGTPALTEHGGSIPAPRPAWATKYAKPDDHRYVCFMADPIEVPQQIELDDTTEVILQARLTTLVSPDWVEWDLEDPLIRISQDHEEYSIDAAEKLANAILAAVHTARQEGTRE